MLLPGNIKLYGRDSKLMLILRYYFPLSAYEGLNGVRYCPTQARQYRFGLFCCQAGTTSVRYCCRMFYYEAGTTALRY